MGVVVEIAKPDLFAVRKEDEGDAELPGVALALGLSGAEVDTRALGFEDGQRPADAIEEHVVGAATVVEDVLEARAAPVGQVPTGVAEELIDLDAGKGFVPQDTAPPAGVRLVASKGKVHRSGRGGKLYIEGRLCRPGARRDLLALHPGAPEWRSGLQATAHREQRTTSKLR